MKKPLIALCCVLMTASAVALAQSTTTGNTPTTNPTLLKGEAEKKRQEGQKKMAGCINKAQQDKIAPGSDEFNRYMNRCMAG